VDPSKFDYKVRSGVITSLGWCGSTVSTKRLDWSHKIAEKTDLPVNIAHSLSIEDIRKWYHTIDLLIMTAGPEVHVETGPLPPFEAIASGIPVIGTSVGNFRLLPGPKFSTIEEAVTIIQDLKKNPAAMIQLAKDQYEAVLANWTYREIAPKWREMFEKALQV